jgi:hypothetical protein
LLVPVALSSHHVAARLVEGVHLLGSQVTSDLAKVSNDLLNKGLILARLESDKVPPALFGDLDESIARHVLHTWKIVSGARPG